MGIWGQVKLIESGPVQIKSPAVVSHILPNGVAELGVLAELTNVTNTVVSGRLRGQIGKAALIENLTLQPGETRSVRWDQISFPQLIFKNAQLWWPTGMGSQPLYSLKLDFFSSDLLSSYQEIKFGIREVTSSLDDLGHRVFSINGKRVFIRGGGWSPDLLLRSSPARQEDEIRYVQNLNLNTLRIEGKLEDEHFFDLCDRYGILVIAGWCCCDAWEELSAWGNEQPQIAALSLKSQLLRLRKHPSVIAWMYGSDGPSPASVESLYLKSISQANWPNPVLSSASQKLTESGTEPTGVKMLGPYDWVPPIYWYEDTARGGLLDLIPKPAPEPHLCCQKV